MGTLFNQLDRDERLTKSRIMAYGRDIKEIADELGISFNDALNLYLTIGKIDDYNSKDEQLAGFGELLQSLINVISERD